MATLFVITTAEGIAVNLVKRRYATQVSGGRLGPGLERPVYQQIAAPRREPMPMSARARD
jgi:hypothetical protein